MEAPLRRQSERKGRFFDHMLTTADASRDGDGALLRRQAVYLLGFDDRPSTMMWLTAEFHRIVRRNGATDTPAGFLLGRGAALGLARQGVLAPVLPVRATSTARPGQASPSSTSPRRVHKMSDSRRN